MLYIADLKRDGLLKVGIAGWWRTDRRQSELRRQWKAPKLEIISSTLVPFGWGSEAEWERRLIARLKKENGTLQLFGSSESGREIVDCTKEEARRGLAAMFRCTEIDPSLDADEIPADKVDWRFCNGFMSYKYRLECRVPCEALNYWKDVLTRQAFIQWLRGDEWARIPERLFSA